MNRITVFYNPFLPELKISINDKVLSPYSALMSFQHQRLEKWVDVLFTELYREVNDEFEILCVSSEFACEWLEVLAQKNPHCASFSAQSLPMNANIYERLDKLETLGGEENVESIVIPIVNASDNSDMTDAFFGVLEEQGIFEDVSSDGILWTECPLTTLEIKPFDVNDVPYSAPAIIALCSSEDDYLRVDSDSPVYALIMSTETRFIRRQGNRFYFNVDPDEIGKMILGIIEEEALCPSLSDLSYNFPAEAKEFLTESEKEELELICHASPICNVTLPKICDVGRSVELKPQVFPSDSGAEIRIVTNSNDVIDVGGNILYPRSTGTAEISVFIGDDPYPVATELIKVRQRTLISDITLFPSALYMPLGGEKKLSVTVVPSDAENMNEICWRSDDTAVAVVDEITGVITAVSCGTCRITAYTEEALKTVCLEVQPRMEDIYCSSGFLEVNAGEQKEWRYQVVPPNAYGVDLLHVVSSDINIAEYRGGYIVGKNSGDCRIYIKNPEGTISRELKVTVKKKKFW